METWMGPYHLHVSKWVSSAVATLDGACLKYSVSLSNVRVDKIVCPQAPHYPGHCTARSAATNFPMGFILFPTKGLFVWGARRWWGYERLTHSHTRTHMHSYQGWISTCIGTIFQNTTPTFHTLLCGNNALKQTTVHSTKTSVNKQHNPTRQYVLKYSYVLLLFLITFQATTFWTAPHCC
jgi:thiaminase